MLYCKVKGQQIGFVAAPQKDDIFICQGWTRTLLFNSGGLSTCVPFDMQASKSTLWRAKLQPRTASRRRRRMRRGRRRMRMLERAESAPETHPSYKTRSFSTHHSPGYWQGDSGVGAGRHWRQFQKLLKSCKTAAGQNTGIMITGHDIELKVSIIPKISIFLFWQYDVWVYFLDL